MANIDSGLLIIGSVELSINSYFNLSQDYYEIEGGTFERRSLNGTLRKQVHWNKLATSISCQGSLPVGLSAMDFNSAYYIHCAAHRAISGTVLSYSIPGGAGAYRVDVGYAPRAFGLFGRSWVETSFVDVNGTLTLDAIAGASIYEIRYYPILSVMSKPPRESSDVHGKVTSWSIEAEEV